MYNNDYTQTRAGSRCFDMDIYNKEIKVEFIEYIRGILSFEDVPDLISQMKRDIEKIRAVLEKRSTHLNPSV